MATAPPILIWQPAGGTPSGEGPMPPGPLPGTGITNAGVTPLINGQSYIDVVFDSVQVDNAWIFVECSVFNTDDPDPLNIWPGIITSKLATGFRLQLNGMPDSDNYFLNWAVSGVNIVPTPATTYILSGSTSGLVGVAQTFTVHLPASTTVPTGVEVTPSDSGGGGAFSPTFVTLTTGAPSTTFTYTPASTGTKTISVTNNGGLLNPTSIEVSVAESATGYSLSGPSSGTVAVASTPFTVTLTPAGGGVPAPVTITPSDGGGGGTFAPTTVNLTTAAPSATFTYTPASTGTKTISTSNNGGLTDPGSLSYTVMTTLAVNLISYWTMDEASGTRNDSQGTNHLSPTNAPVGAAGKINNGLQLVAASSQYLSIANNASLQVTGSFTFSVWAKLTSQGTWRIAYKGVTFPIDYAVLYDATNGYSVAMNNVVTITDVAYIGAPVANGVWTHIVAWYDSAVGQLFIKQNNIAGTPSTTAFPLIQTTGVLYFGQGNGQYFDGIIDEMGFWKRVLTASEITALYNGGAGLPFSSF